MTDANISAEFDHVMGMKDVTNQTILLSQVQTATLCGDDSSSVLAAMLQHSQSIKEQLIHLENDNENVRKWQKYFSLARRPPYV